MRIGSERPRQEILVQGNAAGHMHFLDRTRRQCIEERIGIKAVILPVHIEVLYVEQDPGAGLAADKLEKLCVRQFRIRPVEDVGDVLEQEWNRNPRLDGPHLGDDQFGDRLGFRQGKEIAEIASRDSRESEVFAVGGCLEAVHKAGDLVHISKVERLVGADRKPDAMRGQRDFADQIEVHGAVSLAAGHAMVQGDLKHIEAREVRARPFIEIASIPDANRGSEPASPFCGTRLRTEPGSELDQMPLQLAEARETIWANRYQAMVS